MNPHAIVVLRHSLCCPTGRKPRVVVDEAGNDHRGNRRGESTMHANEGQTYHAASSCQDLPFAPRDGQHPRSSSLEHFVLGCIDADCNVFEIGCFTVSYFNHLLINFNLHFIPSVLIEFIEIYVI